MYPNVAQFSILNICKDSLLYTLPLNDICRQRQRPILNQNIDIALHITRVEGNILDIYYPENM